MKLSRNLLLAFLVLSAFSVNAENGSSSEPQADGRHDRDRDHERDHEREHHENCPCKLEGCYSYELSGYIGILFPDRLFNEAGRICFDGRGRGTGFALSVLGSVPGGRRITANYEFTYSRLSEGVYEAQGTRDSSVAFTNIRFGVTTGDKCEHISLVWFPNQTPITNENDPNILFNFVQVSGFGGK